MICGGSSVSVSGLSEGIAPELRVGSPVRRLGEEGFDVDGGEGRGVMISGSIAIGVVGVASAVGEVAGVVALGFWAMLSYLTLVVSRIEIKL